MTQTGEDSIFADRGPFDTNSMNYKNLKKQ